MDRKNLIVGQSGGPTAVINSSLYGIVKGGRDQAEVDRIYGMVNGIEGFLKGQVMDFDVALPGEDLETLKYTPGAYLGSCRHKLPENLDDLAYKQIFASFHDMNIGYFVYIGGNDSMDTVSKLSRYGERIGSDVRILGIPKTIDNDLVKTDHTPGYMEVLPDMWHPQCGRLLLMLMFMRKNLLQLLKSWAVMRAG